MSKNKFLDDDSIIVIILALLVGFIAGIIIQSEIFMPVRLFFHNVYTKLNPDSKKDSYTLIIENVTKSSPNLPQKNIFEEPAKKENGFVLYVKKVFAKNKKTEKRQTINDFVLN